MTDFKYFVGSLIKGNLEEVRGCLKKEFVNKIINDHKRFPIQLACEKGFFNIVKLLLQHNCNIECETKGKMRPIHFASRNGHFEIVKLLLKYHCNFECETYERQRPIHFASENGHVNIVLLLLQQNCRIDCKAGGRTPLDLAKQNNRTDCVELLSHSDNLFTAIERNDPIEFEKLYKSCYLMAKNIYAMIPVLELALENKADKIIKFIIDKPVDNKEINDLVTYLNTKNLKNPMLIKECILYRCIIQQHLRGFKTFNTAGVINGHCRIVESSFLEIAAEHGVFVDEIMKKTIFDKSIWLNAIEKAKEKEIQEELSERMILLESRLKKNFTILHTAICDNDADMVKYILNHPNIVDLNSNNETFGTALALAHSLHHRKCIKILQPYQLNTNTQNKYSQTPLHEAIGSGMENSCKYLIDRAINIDQTGFLGLTGLHFAVIQGMINVCGQLVNKGADFVRYVDLSNQTVTNEIIIPFAKSIIPLSHRENSLTLSMKFHETLFPCFLDRLDSNSSNVCDGDNNSLLHLAVTCLNSDMCRSLLSSGANANYVNYAGNSPLLHLIYEAEKIVNTADNMNKIIDITSILIKYGADINVKSSNGIPVIQSVSKIGSEKLMIALVSNHQKLNLFSSKDFQIAFTNQWFEYAEILIKILPDEFLSICITNKTFQQCKTTGLKLIKLLFDKSSSDLKQLILENLLYDAVNNDDNELFDHFINTPILVPKELQNGETLLTFILKENKIPLAWKLLDSKNELKYVNFKNRKNQYPLDIAIEIEELDLIDNLIHASNEFNCEDNEGKTPLTRLLEKISTSNNSNFKRRLIPNIKTIIQLGGDIYHITSRGQRIIDACTESNAKTKIEEFYKEILIKSKQEKIERGMCNICMDRCVNTSFQCGHLFCSDCADRVFLCPVCNAEIINRIQIYFN